MNEHVNELFRSMFIPFWVGPKLVEVEDQGEGRQCWHVTTLEEAEANSRPLDVITQDQS